MANTEKKALMKATMAQAAEDAAALLEQIGLKPAAFARVAMNAALTNPEILDCTPGSLRHAILLCAQRGVLPDGDSAAIVPFKGKAQLIMGYKGMCDIARRSIKGIVIRTQVVTTDDEWEYEEGLVDTLSLKRNPQGARPTESNIVAVYALARMPGNSAPEYVVMFKSELDHIRKTYASKSTAAAREYAEWAKKTAARRLLKMLPTRSGLLMGEQMVDDSSVYDDPDDPDNTIDVTAEPADEDPEPADPKPKPKPKPRRARRTTAKPPEPEPQPEPQSEWDAGGDPPDTDPGF